MKKIMTKSARKRFRVTKNGKILRRFMAVDHFRTRQSTKTMRHKRRVTGLDYPKKKILNY